VFVDDFLTHIDLKAYPAPLVKGAFKMRNVWSMKILVVLLVAVVAQGCMVRLTDYRKLQDEHALVVAHVEGLEDEVASKEDDLGRLQAENETLRAQLGDRDPKIVRLEEPPRTTPQLTAIWAKLEAVATGRKDVAWDATGHKLIVSVDFDLGRATVRPAGKASIKQIAGVLRGVPSGYVFYVDGHTDNLPVKHPTTLKKYGDNPGLAAARALAVMRVLREGGVRPKLMVARSFGPYYPIVPNADKPSRAKNRRVEISVVPAGTAFSPTAMLVPESDVAVK